MRRVSLLLITVSGLIGTGWAVASAQEPSPAIGAGTYRGAVQCAGTDRFSNGARTRHYRSSPTASVSFGAGQRLSSWTYFFLLRHDLVKQVHAVRPGASFSYAAGRHLGKPGRTRVTVTDVIRTRGRELINARLGWASPSTQYIGSGAYALLLERIGRHTLRYEAIKVVVKHSLTAPSKTRPVIRRNEFCVGQLTS